MEMQLAALGYTILVGLIAIAFWLGRLSERVKIQHEAADFVGRQLAEIFDELRNLTEKAAANEAWHHPPGT